VRGNPCHDPAFPILAKGVRPRLGNKMVLSPVLPFTSLSSCRSAVRNWIATRLFQQQCTLTAQRGRVSRNF
jgi:hypothetical protein